MRCRIPLLASTPQLTTVFLGKGRYFWNVHRPLNNIEQFVLQSTAVPVTIYHFAASGPLSLWLLVYGEHIQRGSLAIVSDFRDDTIRKLYRADKGVRG
eukprot:3331377-Amphidinium_carterae.1